MARWGRQASYAPEIGAVALKGTVDFTTYLNGLSVKKWRRCTIAKDFVIRLELTGDACEVFATGLKAGGKEPKRGASGPEGRCI